MSEDVSVTLAGNWELVVRGAMAKETAAAAEKIRDAAVALASEHVDTGRYRDGIVVDYPNGESKGTARVRASDEKSSWMEFGNYHHPGYFILRNAAESLGYTFVKKDR